MAEQQNNAIDLSKVQPPQKPPVEDILTSSKNKNGIYFAIIVVSFFLTIFLYSAAFKNMTPSKPDLEPLPPVQTSYRTVN